MPRLKKYARFDRVPENIMENAFAKCESLKQVYKEIVEESKLFIISDREKGKQWNLSDTSYFDFMYWIEDKGNRPKKFPKQKRNINKKIDNGMTVRDVDKIQSVIEGGNILSGCFLNDGKVFIHFEDGTGISIVGTIEVIRKEKMEQLTAVTRRKYEEYKHKLESMGFKL